MKIFQHKDFDFTTIICNLKEAFQDYQKNNKTSTKGYKEYKGGCTTNSSIVMKTGAEEVYLRSIPLSWFIEFGLFNN